jgi:hypothetical protein
MCSAMFSIQAAGLGLLLLGYVYPLWCLITSPVK